MLVAGAGAGTAPPLTSDQPEQRAAPLSLNYSLGPMQNFPVSGDQWPGRQADILLPISL